MHTDAETRAHYEWIALRCQAGEAEGFEDLIALMEQPLLYYAASLTGNADSGLDVLHGDADLADQLQAVVAQVQQALPNILALTNKLQIVLDNAGAQGDFANVQLSAVPEPATWAMMLVGFGGLGAAIRSRRRFGPATA